jgi:hypothetical protein
MRSAVAVQVKMRGFWLCPARYASMAAISSGTLAKLPRRMRLSVISRNHRYTMFNQELEVGMKCRWNRGWRRSQDVTRGCLWVA